MNPGRTLKGGRVVGFDKFDKDIATKIAVGKLVGGETVPHVMLETPLTKRATLIKQQVDLFRQQAAKVFKDKTEVLVQPQKQMVKTEVVEVIGSVGIIGKVIQFFRGKS